MNEPYRGHVPVQTDAERRAAWEVELEYLLISNSVGRTREENQRALERIRELRALLRAA